MEKRLRLEDTGHQAGARAPAPGTEVKIAIDLSRTKWVDCVRWGGQVQRRRTTPADRTHDPGRGNMREYGFKSRSDYGRRRLTGRRDHRHASRFLLCSAP